MSQIRQSIGGLIAIILLLTSVFPQVKTSAGAPNSLDARIRAELGQFKGKVSLFAKNLETGASYGFGADDRVRTASTIKVPIMVEVFARVAAGQAQWSDKLTLTKEKKVSGSGVLQELSDGLQLTLQDAVNLMIVVSDNTATNLILDHITADAVNARMDELGLKQTRALRKIGGGGVSKAGTDPANVPFGLGITTPREMVLLLEKLAKGQLVSPAASEAMLAIMKREQNRNGIGRQASGVELATKYGALNQLRSHIGIIYDKRGRIAMAISCDEMPEVNWSPDNPANLLIARLSQLLVEGLSAAPAGAEQ